jgi:hypothetical protein
LTVNKKVAQASGKNRSTTGGKPAPLLGAPQIRNALSKLGGKRASKEWRDKSPRGWPLKPGAEMFPLTSHLSVRPISRNYPAPYTDDGLKQRQISVPGNSYV